MPSSDGEQRFGTIFMGPTTDRETTLDKLYDVTQRDLWNQRTEDEYMERVKARATERVRALLLQARKRGDEILTQAESNAGSLKAEAEKIKDEAFAVRAEADQVLDDARAVREEAAVLRDAAHQEGFEAGRGEALAQLDEERKALAETTAVVLLGIQEQCGHIFEAWRDDLTALLREAVEKSTGWVMDQNRAEVLGALLDQSMRAMLDRRQFTVRVNPADAALVTDMLADAHKANARALAWELATDPNLEPGSLVVESDAALVDNSRKARRSIVDEVLEHLSLPQSDADQAAFEGVTRTLVDELRKHGVDLEDGGDESPDATFASGPDVDQGADLAPDAPLASAIPPVDLSAESQPEPPMPEPPGQAQAGQESAEDFAAHDEFAKEATQASGFGDADQAAFGAAPEGETLDDIAAPDDMESKPDEAGDLVREFLDDAPQESRGVGADDAMESGLPPDLADELLADMGFGPDGSSGREQ